jgi:predicted dehydrogenase
MDVNKGGARRIRVGIIGANPDRGWAAQAHIPALKSLSRDFEITEGDLQLTAAGGQAQPVRLAAVHWRR